MQEGNAQKSLAPARVDALTPAEAEVCRHNIHILNLDRSKVRSMKNNHAQAHYAKYTPNFWDIGCLSLGRCEGFSHKKAGMWYSYNKARTWHKDNNIRTIVTGKLKQSNRTFWLQAQNSFSVHSNFPLSSWHTTNLSIGVIPPQQALLLTSFFFFFSKYKLFKYLVLENRSNKYIILYSLMGVSISC